MGAPPKGRGGAGRGPRVHTITLGLLFPLFPVNIYLIDGDVPTLIDTGLNTDVAWRGLVDGLSAVGRGTGDIKQVVLTHGHIDHVGLCPRLLDEGSPEILIHWGDAGRVRSDVEELVTLLESNAARFKKMGIAPRDVDRLFRSYISVLRRFHVGPFPIRELSDGDVIECGGLTVSIVHTPGHTAGSVCLLDDANRILFSGDHVMEGTSTNPLAEMIPQKGVGLIPYLASIKRIDDIAPVTILPGHGTVINKPAEYLSRITFQHETTAQRIRQSLDADGTTPAELAGRLFPEIGGIAAGSAVFEVYCRLMELVEKREAVVDEREGLFHFRGGSETLPAGGHITSRSSRMRRGK
ncbi:MAG: MBL fold metallo-hydrolase [Deltaproteobacteria bacterium]|nr:MBL fold metallo-hydrolase [Candidatus Zymogenaceae bacterium]